MRNMIDLYLDRTLYITEHFETKYYSIFEIMFDMYMSFDI